ncbi:Protein MAIN-LIKE 1 [Glycine soja]
MTDHLVPSGELCVVPGQVAPDYKEWFFQISHSFVTWTEETAEPRHPLPPYDEELVEPPIPEVSVATNLPTHSVGMTEDLGAIAEDFERVINLRMVTEGTDLHDIMTRCLRRARGDAADGIGHCFASGYELLDQNNAIGASSCCSLHPKLYRGLQRYSFFRKNSGRRIIPDDLSNLQKNLPEEVVLPEQFRKNHFFRKIMARTRGLGRAIGRLVGRDRPDDQDAADVPERHRPTASARRLRAHQMTAEGHDMAEDVADMTDDVPELAAEAPEMRADIQGADGGEGSDADDAAEGFPGGPRDPSVLTSFAEHVAHAVWSGQERPDLKLVSHGRKVALIGRPVLEIEGLVAATGLSPLIDCSVITGDPGLISAFVERWHGETSTFHLPVGKLMITLDDVSSLLHLPITGALHSFQALSTEEAIFLLTELLEVSVEEARAETTLTRGAYSATYVHVVHLDAFRDLAQSGGYAWGVAALVHMYDQLDEACRTTTRQLAGYLTLLQHFPSVHQCVTDDTYQETSPRASRWLTSKAHMKGIIGAPYRARCDGLTVTDVSWLPYTEHRGVRAFQEISSFQGQLRWGPMVVTARPERVSIPPPPVSARLSHDQIDDMWMQFAEHLLPAGQLCLVLGQVSADYMEWFFRISHPFMIPTQAGDQPRDAPATDLEDYIQLPNPQVPVAFDPPPHVDDYEGYEAIAQRLERVLNLRIVTAGTKLYDIMQDCLTIARGGPSADGTVRALDMNISNYYNFLFNIVGIIIPIVVLKRSLRVF